MTQNWPETYFFDILIPKMTFLCHFWAILAQKVTSREKVKNDFFSTKTTQNYPETYFFDI